MRKTKESLRIKVCEGYKNLSEKKAKILLQSIYKSCLGEEDKVYQYECEHYKNLPEDEKRIVE